MDVEVTFNNPEEVPKNLLAGYSADVEIILEARDKVLRPPTQAILEGNKVLAIGKDGRLQERTLTLGLANWAYTDVAKGLTKGERVVSRFESEAIQAGALAEAMIPKRAAVEDTEDSEKIQAPFFSLLPLLPLCNYFVFASSASPR